MVEIGYLNLLLTVYSGDEVISIQPFNVLIYDDYMGGAASFIELIQELQKMIENMAIDLNNAIKITEKGQPNGVASLDKDGKIPLPQMPKEFQGFIDHITQTVFEHRVHGFGIDEDGMGMYETPNGDWQYIGLSPDGKGNGATQLVEATITVKDGKATVTYEGVPTVVSNKWFTGDRKVEYFLLNGTSFTGNSFNVSALGTHTLYYKDSNGTEYVKTFDVTADMFNKPSVTIEVDDGYVTVTIPPTANVTTKKWDKGNRDVTYFKYNGTIFTGNTFKVEEVGTYTVYVKTSGGLEYVYVFEVTEDMLPIISKPEIIITNTSRHYTNGVPTTNHSIHIKIRDTNYKITKYKPFNSSNYIEYSTPLDATTWISRYNQDIDFGISSNRNKELVYGFENEIGQRSEFVVYADSNFVYYWINGESEATLANAFEVNFTSATTFTVPSSIKGKTITSVGEMQNSTFQYIASIKTLNIPSTVKRIYPIFGYAENLTRVNIYNPNLEFISYSSASTYPFSSTMNTVVIHASNNSTAKTFVQERQGDPLYKLAFQAT